jgi:hypothetical protein
MKKVKKDDRGGRPPKPATPASPMDAAMEIIVRRHPVGAPGADGFIHRSPGLRPTVGSQPVDVSLEIAGLKTWIVTLAGLLDRATGFASPPDVWPRWEIEEHRVAGVPRWRVRMKYKGPWAEGTWHDDLAGALRALGLETQARAVDRKVDDRKGG